MRRLAVLLVLLGTLAVSSEAGARIVTADDGQGRSITFDVDARNVDLDWYAELLGGAAHGDEIERVTIRIVSPRRVGAICGPEAGGCYGRRGSRGAIVVPAGRSVAAAHTLLHEYAHHLDRSRGVRGAAEPNGTASWWRARDVQRLLDDGLVARDYGLGWDRSVGEIFAEDYVQLHLQAPYRIGWLEPPGNAVRESLRRDLEGVPAAPSTPAITPLVIERAGTLAPGERRALPFGLLGPGRRVTFTARVAGESEPGVRGRLELVCGARARARTIARGQRSATIDVRGLGPAECEVALANASSAPYRFTIRLRLAVER